MNRTRPKATEPWILASAFAAALILTGCGGHRSAASVTESFSQTVELSSGGELAISNVNGSIEITSWDRNEVHIDAVKKASSLEKLEGIEIEVEVRDGRVEIDADLPFNGNASVDYRISAPSDVQVDADTVNGSIHVSGVQGDVAAHSVNGRIEADGLAASAHIKTVNGSVTATYETTPTAGEHRFKSVNGSITVRLPAAPSARFAARSVTGSIRNDFGLEVHKARYGPMQSMEGSLGSGDGEFEFHTVNGAIKILSSQNLTDAQ